MSKIAFVPVSLLAGAAAGFLSQKLFDAVWGAVDSQEPPQPDHRRAGLGKLAAALAIQGATASVVRGLVAHGSRRGFHHRTGAWPGEHTPQHN
ncbi:MAG: hypothetical protein NVSMB51_07800 [Solirubrobacteraceae bacterium]